MKLIAKREGGYISLDGVEVTNVKVGEVLDLYSGFGEVSQVQSVSIDKGVGEITYEGNVKIPMGSGLIAELIVSDLIELFGKEKR